MKDKLFNWGKLLIENFKVVITILSLVGFGGFQAMANSDKSTRLKGEIEASKIYADLAHGCHPDTTTSSPWHQPANIGQLDAIMNEIEKIKAKIKKEH